MAEEKRSKVEEIKEKSGFLAGQLLTEISDDAVPTISNESYELGKHHGWYYGYDRDTATERKKKGLDKEWEFMVRMKCPGGRLTPAQYMALDEICGRYANGSLRITTRQTFQFHSVLKGNLQAHIKAINEQLLTTLGGCGDVVRNITCTAAPYKNPVYEKIFSDVDAIAKFTLPKTPVYHEIWVEGQNLALSAETEAVEPLYGTVYLPRKFKIAVGVPEDNSADMLTHDLAVILIYENEQFLGYNICMGGGLGITHNKPETYPRLATPIAFVEPDHLLRAVEAVIKLQRDHGDRANRKHARLKYVVEEKGVAWTRQTLEKYYGQAMQDPRPMKAFAIADHMGWHPQGDGKWFLGVPVDSGRIIDTDATKIRSVLREVVAQYQPDIYLTCDQNIILAEIAEEQKAAIEAVFKKHAIKLRDAITDIHRFFLACVALPSCGKALAEAERVKLPIVRNIEEVMAKHGVLGERITIRMTGCPNGCARPYVGDIGIVGRTPGHYAIYIGGDFEGTRLNTKILDRVPFDNISDVFDLLFEYYAAEKKVAEGFGDYSWRIGVETLVARIVERLGPLYQWAVAA